VGAQQLLQALQGAMMAGGGAAPAPPAPAPPPAQQPALVAAGGPTLNAQQLLQALQGAMAAATAGGAAHAPAGSQPPVQQHAQQAAAPSSSRQGADRHVTTPRPTVPRPDWAAPADTWAAFPPPPDCAILSSAEAGAEGSAVQQACCKVFGQAVSLGPASGTAAALHLPLVPAGPGGSLRLTAAAVDAALARLPGSGAVLDLQAAWLRAAQAAQAPECEEAQASAVLHLLQARLARRAAGVLANDDDDDLFFTGGKHRSALHRALVRGPGGGGGAAVVCGAVWVVGQLRQGGLASLWPEACRRRRPKLRPALCLLATALPRRCISATPFSALLSRPSPPQESGGVAPAFLDALVCCTATPAEAALWEGVMRDSFATLKGFSFLDPHKSEGAWKRWVAGPAPAAAVGTPVRLPSVPCCLRALPSRTVCAAPLPPRRLDVVTQCPGMKRCLAALLVREAVAAAGTRGSEVEARSLLAPLLGLTALPSWGPRLLPLNFPARDCFMQLRWVGSGGGGGGGPTGGVGGGGGCLVWCVRVVVDMLFSAWRV
jgi:hypothetical protein